MDQAGFWRSGFFALPILLSVAAFPLSATPCIVPEYGTGTFNLPLQRGDDSSPGKTTFMQVSSWDSSVNSWCDITSQTGLVGTIVSVLGAPVATTSEWTRIQTEIVATDCSPLPNGLGCEPVMCPEPPDACMPVCAEIVSVSFDTLLNRCECLGPSEWGLTFYSVFPSKACLLPDDGTGTATLPPAGCEYQSPDEVFLIIDGLPTGSTIELDGPLGQFDCDGATGLCSLGLPQGSCEAPGGTLAGDGHCFSAFLDFNLTGTGSLAGFNRSISIPVKVEIHTGPRTPGDAVQTFPAEMYRLQGEIVGDPDFDLLRITAGRDFLLPGPGQTTLIRLPSGDFVTDSFFNISYQIEFVGTPGSPLEGLAGTTTATVRIKTGNTPSCSGVCPPNTVCTTAVTEIRPGVYEICCAMTPEAQPVIFFDGFESGSTSAWNATVP